MEGEVVESCPASSVTLRIRRPGPATMNSPVTTWGSALRVIATLVRVAPISTCTVPPLSGRLLCAVMRTCVPGSPAIPLTGTRPR